MRCSVNAVRIPSSHEADEVMRDKGNIRFVLMMITDLYRVREGSLYDVADGMALANNDINVGVLGWQA